MKSKQLIFIFCVGRFFKTLSPTSQFSISIPLKISERKPLVLWFFQGNQKGTLDFRDFINIIIVIIIINIIIIIIIIIIIVIIIINFEIWNFKLPIKVF